MLLVKSEDRCQHHSAEALHLRVCRGGRFTCERGGIEADAAASTEVECVVLNALPNEMRLSRLIFAPSAFCLPSVRAGLAFSGEADPPLIKVERVGTIRPARKLTSTVAAAGSGGREAKDVTGAWLLE
jgi:hypothetical protein